MCSNGNCRCRLRVCASHLVFHLAETTWIHGINSEIHHCDYALSPSGFDAWMQSLNQFFCSCVRVNFYILNPGCCGLRIEYCNAIFACISDEANRPTGHWHRMPRLSKDVWLNIFIWSTPAQSLFTWNCVLCIGGRLGEPIDCYCCAASEHVHGSSRAPTGQAHTR